MNGRINENKTRLWKMKRMRVAESTEWLVNAAEISDIRTTLLLFGFIEWHRESERKRRIKHNVREMYLYDIHVVYCTIFVWVKINLFIAMMMEKCALSTNKQSAKMRRFIWSVGMVEWILGNMPFILWVFVACWKIRCDCEAERSNSSLSPLNFRYCWATSIYDIQFVHIA